MSNIFFGIFSTSLKSQKIRWIARSFGSILFFFDCFAMRCDNQMISSGICSQRKCHRSDTKKKFTVPKGEEITFHTLPTDRTRREGRGKKKKKVSLIFVWCRGEI